jgi:hypothetical protein
MVVAAVAFVDMDAAGFDLGQRRPVRQLRPQSVAVEKIAVQRLGVQHKLAALGLGGRGRQSPANLGA